MDPALFELQPDTYSRSGAAYDEVDDMLEPLPEGEAEIEWVAQDDVRQSVACVVALFGAGSIAARGFLSGEEAAAAHLLIPGVVGKVASFFVVHTASGDSVSLLVFEKKVDSQWAYSVSAAIAGAVDPERTSLFVLAAEESARFFSDQYIDMTPPFVRVLQNQRQKVTPRFGLRDATALPIPNFVDGVAAGIMQQSVVHGHACAVLVSYGNQLLVEVETVMAYAPLWQALSLTKDDLSQIYTTLTTKQHGATQRAHLYT